MALTYSSQVAQQQAALNAANFGKAGYTPLKVDGLLGPLTQAAISQWGSGGTSTTKAPVSSQLSAVSSTLPKYDAQGGFTSGGTYYAPNSIQATNSRTISGPGTASNPPPVAGQMNALTSPATPPTSPTQPVPSPYKPTSNPYEKQYEALLKGSPEVEAAQKAINDHENAYRAGWQKVEDKPIEMGFIRGQQESLERRNVNLQIPLQQRLANAQAQRQASLDSVRFGLERADKMNEFNADEQYRYASLNKPSSSNNPYLEVSPGASLFDPATKTSIYTAPTAQQTNTANTLDTSSKAAVMAFQAANGLKVDGIVGPQTIAKMNELGISPTGKTPSGGSGTPTVTQQKTLLTKTLNTGIAPNGTKLGAPRGADGYVDPYVYIEAFKQWTGTPSQFLSAFPVKTNINPASYSLLPAALQPTSSGGSRSA